MTSKGWRASIRLAELKHFSKYDTSAWEGGRWEHQLLLLNLVSIVHVEVAARPTGSANEMFSLNGVFIYLAINSAIL